MGVAARVLGSEGGSDERTGGSKHKSGVKQMCVSIEKCFDINNLKTAYI